MFFCPHIYPHLLQRETGRGPSATALAAWEGSVEGPPWVLRTAAAGVCGAAAEAGLGRRSWQAWQRVDAVVGEALRRRAVGGQGCVGSEGGSRACCAGRDGAFPEVHTTPELPMPLSPLARPCPAPSLQVWQEVQGKGR